MAADLFVVPTVTFRLLFVLVILAHDRRRIVHVALTAHPTTAWTPRYLIHDRDSVFAGVATTLAGMNVRAVRTARRAPWQNAYVERIIGSIRRECLGHVIVLNATGRTECLQTTSRTTCGRERISRKDTPGPRPVTPPSAGRIVAIPEVGGLHHRYDRVAA
jgi:putative transposase